MEHKHRCLLRHAKLFAVATRNLYRIRYKRLREIRGENNRALYHRTARRDRSSPQRYLHTWTSAPLLRARPLLSYSHAPPVGRTPTALRARRNLQERPNTPAGELGLDLGPSDYTAAAWDTPHEAAATMDSDEDSLTLNDDTVYENV